LSAVLGSESDEAILAFWQLIITEASDYALARLALLIAKGLDGVLAMTDKTKHPYPGHQNAINTMMALCHFPLPPSAE